MAGIIDTIQNIDLGSIGIVAYVRDLGLLKLCDDESCCCLATRTSIALISVLSLGASVIDAICGERCECGWQALVHLGAMRALLVTLFQMANLLLLLASFLENPALVQIYVWYTLGFIALGFAVSIVDFILRLNDEEMASYMNFITEVVFLFALTRCLPIVECYKKQLEPADSESQAAPRAGSI